MTDFVESVHKNTIVESQGRQVTFQDVECFEVTDSREKASIICNRVELMFQSTSGQ